MERTANNQPPVRRSFVPDQVTQALYNEFGDSAVAEDMIKPGPGQVPDFLDNFTERIKAYRRRANTASNGRKGRDGPLDDLTRLKTNLVRKLGACEYCRERGIPVRECFRAII